MPSDGKNKPLHPTFKLFQLVTMPYRHWAEKRRLAQELLEEQHKTAEATNNQLRHFHEELWSRWPNAVQHVRQHIRKEENTHE